MGRNLLRSFSEKTGSLLERITDTQVTKDFVTANLWEKHLKSKQTPKFEPILGGAWDALYTEEEVMSWRAWTNFVTSRTEEMVKNSERFDCADYIFTLLIEYYRLSKVRLVLYCAEIPLIDDIDSSHSRWSKDGKGFDGLYGYDGFLERVKTTTGTLSLTHSRNTHPIASKDLKRGDIRTTPLPYSAPAPLHAQLFWEKAKDENGKTIEIPEIKIGDKDKWSNICVAQASGAYPGYKNVKPKDVAIPKIENSGNYGNFYRFNFLSRIPLEPRPLAFMQPKGTDVKNLINLINE